VEAEKRLEHKKDDRKKSRQWLSQNEDRVVRLFCHGGCRLGLTLCDKNASLASYLLSPSCLVARHYTVVRGVMSKVKWL